jgi:hypothetical protein
MTASRLERFVIGAATVEGLAIMLLGNCFFVPGRQRHARFRFVRNLALAAGGFSSDFSTSWLSCSDKLTRSASLITILASCRRSE